MVDFEGRVLRAPRISPANAPTTSEPITGVVRDAKALPVAYSLTAPSFVDAYADMYRASVIDAPGTTPVEHSVWAQNTASLGMVSDPTWYQSQGTGTIAQGELEVTDSTPDPVPDGAPVPSNWGKYLDGSTRIVVQDNGDRSVSNIFALVIARGDVDDYDDAGWVDETDHTLGRAGSNPYPVFIPSVADITSSGVVTLSDVNGYVGDPLVQDTLAVLLGGGVSKERGDSIVEVRYSLSAAKFLWSRNDRYQTRLKWVGRMQGWFPLKGNPTEKLGVLEDGATFTVAPMPLGIKSGTFLPGDVGTQDAYSMIRLGISPGASQSTPALIRAYPDNEVEGGFDFSHDPTVDGVVGLGKGTLEFSPDYIALNAGKSVWYVSRDFSEDADGIIGDLTGSDLAPLYISPIPTSWDYPLIRIGNRRYLEPILEPNDASLDSLIVDEGTVSVSLTTGKVRFSAADIAKANPDDAAFDKLYLGAQIVYDGISMGPPQSTKDPVALTGANGKLYIPDHLPLPGFVSGILDAPDGTGAIPDQVGTPASTRPGGDTAVSTTTGRIRQVSDGVGDTFLFSRYGAIREVQVVDRESDLPSSSKIPQGTAYVALEYSDSVGSVVRLSRNDTKNFGSDTVYFIQSTFMPSYYTDVARLFSQTRFVFRFEGDEVLYFRIDSGINSGTYSWAANSLPIQDSYTPEEVAVSIQAAIQAGAGFGLAFVENGSVVLSADDPSDGEVEIGWGGTNKDLTGAAALGFLPGWLVVSGQDNWLPASGMGLGLYRSPVNLDRSSDTPDVRAEDRAVGLLITDDIQQTPFVFFDRPPLEDIAGYDEGVFFSLQTVVEDPEGPTFIEQPLEHFEDIVHRFESRRFDWVTSGLVATKLRRAASNLPFNNLGVVPESMLGAPGIGGGLFVSSDGGPFVSLDQDTDYLLPSDGAVGAAQLITRYGDLRTFGGNGNHTEGTSTFTDTLATFDTDGVVEGDQLQVTGGDAAGTYLIQTVGPTTLTLEPSFLSTSTRPVTWEIYRGFKDDVYDPMVVADQVYKDFNHLTEEPFKVKVLSLLGVFPTIEPELPVQEGEGGGGGGRGDNNEVEGGNPPRDVIEDPEIETTVILWTGALDEAVEHGREMAIRYGLETQTATNQATLAGLTQEKLGDIGNGNLVVPDTTSIRATSGAYSIRLSNDRFAPTLVSAFSNDPIDVEVLDADWTDDDGLDHPIGEVKFNSTLLTSYDLAEVWYVQEFLGSDLLGALEAEYDPLTNEFSFSDVDIVAHAGKKVYFCEQMITEGRLDVSVAPISGTVGFEDPIKEGQVVEMTYKIATVEGRAASDEIEEFLPIYVRGEEAIRSNPTTYMFNVGTPKTIAEHIDPVVYIGPLMQNFSREDYVIDYAPELGGEGRIVFTTKTIPDWAPVKVTYAVYEAKGGERAYDTSQRPVYRPPFFIKAGQDHFGVRGDRTSEFIPGQLMRVGAHTFYVRSTQFFEAYTTTNLDGSTTEGGNVTRVDIFPPTSNEVGSRSPGNDLVSVITNDPVTDVIEPDGDLPVATTARAGFMTTIDISPDAFEFQPVAPGTRTIHFLGNLSAFAIPGHILEMGGYPFTIASTSLNEDGTRTRISLTTPSPVGFLASTNPTVKISYRPVYPPGVRDLLGPAGVLDTQTSTLILFGEEDEAGAPLPGRTLLRGVEYLLDPDSGSVSLQDPVQAALVSGQRLFLRHTKLDTLNLFQSEGVVQYPRYTATYLHGIAPSLENGLLHGRLTGTFSFRAPDVFYWRVPTLRSFLGEAAREAVSSIQAKQPAGGSTMALGAATSQNWEQGRLGILGERRHLTDLDRAARAFLSFYNRAIVAYEQVKESINGAYVGDRDGKFRFFVGKGKSWPTPGYEDDVTGILSSKNLWALAYTQADPSSGIMLTQEDPIVNPGTATLTSGVLTGDFPDSDRLAELILSQIQLITNDVDDILVTGSETPLQIPKTLYPYFNLEAMGFYERMGDSHPFSRLFPTQARVFFTTYPGIGSTDTSTGRYTFGSLFGGSKKATYRKEVGQAGNLAIGPIENISSASLFKRRARARIWKYLPGGIPANAFGVSAEIKEPVIIVTPGFISDLPIDPNTGYPDYLTFLSEGGVGVDATAGDPELSVPGFVPGNQIGWGKPDGSTYLGLYLDAVTIFGNPSYTGLFVRDVQYGCVIRFQDADGDPITDANRILVGTASDQGTPADLFPIEQGDTLLADPPLSVKTAVAATPSTEDIQALAEAMDTYRIGYDVAVRVSGKVIDLTLPSFEDPFFFGLKEILGQNPLDPMTPVGGVVDFTYLEQNPLQIPALFGQARDDSGDFQIPYLKAKATELDRFTEASIDIGFLLAANTGTYIYPDEIIGIDGELVGAANVGDVYSGATLKEAATLMSNADAFEATNNPSTVGVGDLREYDLLLVEAGSGPSAGTEGILSIGRVTNPALGSGNGVFIEPPRFVTQTNPPGAGTNQTGSPIRYVFDNAMVYVNDPSYSGSTPQATPPSGVVLTQDTVLGKSALEFSQIDLIRDIKLHDGQTQGVGGFNDLWSHNPADGKYHNKITIELFARTDSAIADTPAGVGTPGSMPVRGDLLYTITIEKGVATFLDVIGGVGNQNTLALVAATDLSFGDDYSGGAGVSQIVFNGVNLWHLTPLGTDAAWFLPFVTVTTTKSTLYGYECSISVDTYNWDGADKGQSTTGWVGTDRLTFHDVIDLRWARPRGFVHPELITNSLETKLTLHEVTAGGLGGIGCTVNRDVNGVGIPFTFLRRSAETDTAFVGGLWTDAGVAKVPSEDGSLRVPAFEGRGDIPITGTGLRFAGIPSSEYGPTGLICQGTAITESASNAAVADSEDFDNRLASPTTVGGDENNIEPGDLVIVDRSLDPTHRATTKAGTFLVRHLVPGGTTNPRVTMQTSAGAGAGWAGFEFPRGVSFDDGTGELTITDLVPNISTSINQTVGGNPSCFYDPLIVPGFRIYVVRDIAGMGSADETTYRASVISALYTILDDSGPQPVFTLTTYQDARGTALTAAAFKTLFDADAPEGGHYISGMQFLPVVVGGDSLSALTSQIVKLPGNNLVGEDSATVILGARWFTINPLAAHTGTTGLLYSGNAGDPGIDGDLRKTLNPGDVTVFETAAGANNAFVTPQDAVVYQGVIGALYVGNIATAEWNALNNPGTSFGGGVGSTVGCLIPGQGLHLSNALSGNASEGDDGFHAQAGIFLEPSFPQPTFDLVSVNEHVVDATRSLSSSEIGMRRADTVVGIGEVAHTSPEAVSFEVRRIRRWHDIQTGITESIEPLRYAYETRRGRITGYTQTPKQFGIVAAQSFAMTFDTDKSIAPFKTDDVWNDGNTYSGTQLGAFHDEDVNVKAGDLFRLIGDDGAVLEEVPVVAVFEDNRIKLAPPGITTVDISTLDDDGGMRFEVFLRRAPVPHEQSNQELLELVTDRIVHETAADWTAETGGYVLSSGTYEDDVNQMRDDLNVAGITTWSALGVRRGDIVIIDPAGSLPGTTESGGRPVGDTGLLGRTGYVAGLPTPTDDNRGFYRVVGFDETTPTDPVLLVTGLNSLAGFRDNTGATEDVIFPEDVLYQGTLGYALVPTVHDSAVSSDSREGQMDLRATTKKVGATYQTDFWSIRPFSYTIIRPSNLFSEEAVDLVLMMRERMLSWMEEIKAAAQGDRKSGSYFVFQRDEHIEDIGTPGDPIDGLGVLSNLVVTSLLGEVATSPFLNTSDCLSFLDRRFWVQDSKLDSLQPKDSVTMQVFSGGPAFPAAGGPYTAYTDEASGGSSVLPGLPDRIDLVLDNEDRLRPIRYTWLAYRVHTILGTLAGIRRFDAELPGRLEEQERLLLIQETTEKSTT